MRPTVVAALLLVFGVVIVLRTVASRRHSEPTTIAPSGPEHGVEVDSPEHIPQDRQTARLVDAARQAHDLGMTAQLNSFICPEQDRGSELEAAERHHREALRIHRIIGDLEGVAMDYSNLEVVARERGDLPQAEALTLAMMAIERELGNQQGVASGDYELGHLATLRGDPAAAREHWIRARSAYAQLGIQHLVDDVEVALESINLPNALPPR